MSKPELKKTKTFFDVHRAATLTGESVRNLLRKVEEGEIPVMEIRRKFFFLGQDLKVYLQSKKSKL